jgi:Mrp family chromosome partitioning ATPase
MCEFPSHYVEIESIYNQTIGAGYRTLAITSARLGEGKTTLVKSLAKRVRFSGKNVLVVEVNTFNPTLSKKLRELPNKNPTDIIAIKEEGYSLLPAPQSFQEIMRYKETHVLLEAINDWLGSYDCIIFDTSPLQSLNQNNIPSEIVCEACEGTILIIESGKTPANIIEESIVKLKTRKVNLIGSVLNDKNNPTLLSELLRETKRLNGILPKTMVRLRKLLSSLVLLNVSV